MSAPTPPFKALSFRWSGRSGKAGRFLPCEAADPRGSMLQTVDATGRVVIADQAGNTFGGDGLRVIGYRLAAQTDMLDPADVLAWLAAERSRRRKK